MSSEACCVLPQEVSICASDALSGIKESIATDLVKQEVLASVTPVNLIPEAISSTEKAGTLSHDAVTATKSGNLTPEALAKATAAAEVHVLAVDDSILDRKVIEKLLKTSSYKVTTVDSGNKALEFLGLNGDESSLQINISLIITDYCMPGMTGYELLKRVKETSALKEIPVVIMSSENIPNRIQRCLEEGAKEFIMKPVQMSDVERIKSYIQPMPKTCEQQSGLSCNKRKFDSEGFQVQGAERRPRLSGLTVA